MREVGHRQDLHLQDLRRLKWGLMNQEGVYHVRLGCDHRGLRAKMQQCQRMLHYDVKTDICGTARDAHLR
jgi:hypothetical protein